MEKDNNNINLVNIKFKCFILKIITNKGPIVAMGWIKILNDKYNFKIIYINKKINEYWKRWFLNNEDIVKSIDDLSNFCLLI